MKKQNLLVTKSGGDFQMNPLHLINLSDVIATETIYVWLNLTDQTPPTGSIPSLRNTESNMFGNVEYQYDKKEYASWKFKNMKTLRAFALKKFNQKI